MTCGLYIEIVNDSTSRVYELTRLEPDASIASVAWRLERDGETHDVAILKSGQATCTCGDHAFRERHCKHIIAMRYLGLLEK